MRLLQKDDCEWCVAVDLGGGSHGIFQGGGVGYALED